MKYGVCTKCGDTYKLPEGMISGKEYKCFRCGKEYTLKVVSMEDFVYNRLISTKM